MSRTGPILMSGGNPNGHKLEELLETVIAEIQAKNARVQNDPSAAAQTLLQNNADIITRLKECKRLQEHSLKVRSSVGPDQGPMGKPRVGEGS